MLAPFAAANATYSQINGNIIFDSYSGNAESHNELFTGEPPEPTDSLANVAADQIRILLDAGIEVRMLVSEACPDRERAGICLDPRVECSCAIKQYTGI